jgi:hypothetical protein
MNLAEFGRVVEDVKEKIKERLQAEPRGLEPEEPPMSAAAARVPRPKPKPTLPPAAVAMPVEDNDSLTMAFQESRR